MNWTAQEGPSDDGVPAASMPAFSAGVGRLRQPPDRLPTNPARLRCGRDLTWVKRERSFRTQTFAREAATKRQTGTGRDLSLPLFAARKRECGIGT